MCEIDDSRRCMQGGPYRRPKASAPQGLPSRYIEDIESGMTYVMRDFVQYEGGVGVTAYENDFQMHNDLVEITPHRCLDCATPAEWDVASDVIRNREEK